MGQSEDPGAHNVIASEHTAFRHEIITLLELGLDDQGEYVLDLYASCENHCDLVEQMTSFVDEDSLLDVIIGCLGSGVHKEIARCAEFLSVANEKAGPNMDGDHRQGVAVVMQAISTATEPMVVTSLCETFHSWIEKGGLLASHHGLPSQCLELKLEDGV